MVKQLLLASVLVLLLATPAATKGCYIGGNAKKQVCICTVGGRPHGAPMSLCR